MLGALIIVFREVVEAGLVIGIVLAATRDGASAGGNRQPYKMLEIACLHVKSCQAHCSANGESKGRDPRQALVRCR